MDNAAAVAFNRFGFGRRPGDPVPSNPKAWLRAQLSGPDTAPVAGKLDCAAALALVAEQKAGVQAHHRAIAANSPAANDPLPHPVKALVKGEIEDLVANALVTQSPFRERLVWFWANHFTVATKNLVTAGCIGPYLREAIRPHVTGRFSDMLLAVMRHPAMLNYLNQEHSVGPDSRRGLASKKGLNENLARESLELHTVSPASGYSQADVTNYAKILTGWSVEVKDEPRGFVFRPNIHEPGEIEVMGRSWPEGEQGGVAILGWLGTHPSTYRHISEKLVRHFVSDEPPAEDVRRLEAVLRDTGGNLGAASAALIELPGAWVPGAKLRAPQEFVIACLRAAGTDPSQAPNLAAAMAGLGQGLFQAPFPIGWPDKAADWAGSEAMLQRVDFVYGLAARHEALDPVQVADATLGPLLSQGTMDAIKSAGSRRDGLTILMASPEFQRR